MKSKAVLIALVLTSGVANAGCWTVGELRGVAALKGDAYKIGPDGFGKFAPSAYMVSTNGSGSVTNHGDFRCTKMTASAVMCVGGDAGKVTLEVWSVDEETGTVIFTRARSGWGDFDGSAVFVGKVTGQCNIK